MDKVELYYEVAHSHLKEQDQRHSAFDFRALGCIGVATTLAAISSVAIVNLPKDPSVTQFFMMGITAFMYFATLTCGLKALYSRDWRRDPDLAKFASHLQKYEDQALMEWVGDQFRNSIKHNETTLRSKVRWCDRALIALGTLAASLAVFALTV